MILAPHAIAGAGLASMIPEHPIWGFVLGYASHFVLDVIPHWDYKLSSKIEDKNNPMNSDILINKKFILDLFKMGLDTFLGLFLSFLFFGLNEPSYVLVAILCGVTGGVLPDVFQFAYYKWRHWPLSTLQKFHLKMHSKIRLESGIKSGLLIYLALVSWIVAFNKVILGYFHSL